MSKISILSILKVFTSKMSLSEKFKSQVLQIIESFSSENSEESECKEVLTKWEIRDILREIIRNHLKEEINTETIVYETMSSDMKLTNLNDLFNQTTEVTNMSGFLNDMESLMNKSEETCRNIVEVDVNTTSIIEPPLDFADGPITTNIKPPTSPVVLLNDVGRMDTFEIKSPNDANNLMPPNTETIIKNIPNDKKIQEFLKKLEHHEIKLFSVYKEFKDMKMQFQKEVNQSTMPKQNVKKSPTPSMTHLKRSSALTSSPKLGSTARRSISFSSVTDRKKSNNFNATTTLLGARDKIRNALQNKKESISIPKNPKYANVQSTIPKPIIPKRK